MTQCWTDYITMAWAKSCISQLWLTVNCTLKVNWKNVTYLTSWLVGGISQRIVLLTIHSQSRIYFWSQFTCTWFGPYDLNAQVKKTTNILQWWIGCAKKDQTSGYNYESSRVSKDWLNLKWMLHLLIKNRKNENKVD